MPVREMITVIVLAPMAQPDNVITNMMSNIPTKIMMTMMKMKRKMRMSEVSMIPGSMTMKIMMMKMTRTMMKTKGIEEVVIEM